MARVMLMIRERRGSRSTGASEAPARSHAVLIRMIISVSASVLTAASVSGLAARRALANTAEIANHAFGLAIPSSIPPAREGGLPAMDCAVTRGGGDVVGQPEDVGGRGHNQRHPHPGNRQERGGDPGRH